MDISLLHSVYNIDKDNVNEIVTADNFQNLWNMSSFDKYKIQSIIAFMVNIQSLDEQTVDEICNIILTNVDTSSNSNKLKSAVSTVIDYMSGTNKDLAQYSHILEWLV